MKILILYITKTFNPKFLNMKKITTTVALFVLYPRLVSKLPHLFSALSGRKFSAKLGTF